MNISENDNNLYIDISKSSLNLADTLDCGQCFRFKQEGDYFSGVAFGKSLKASQTDTTITFFDTSLDDYEKIWHNFFDMNTDYDQIKSSLLFDTTISNAIEFAGGIRILQQDSFEALCSFIISQNNNIPRIKGSVERFCERFGTKLPNQTYTFPTAKMLDGIKKSDLALLSLGYRDDYIVDCVQKINTGELSIEQVKISDIDTARTMLRTIKGVGPKVCECALLFGFHRLEAFPIDTWIKKVLATYYKEGFPTQAKEIAGVAQQYLFHYIRKCDIT